jgi:uncharacterized protein YjbI with pentapeptide repeats
LSGNIDPSDIDLSETYLIPTMIPTRLDRTNLYGADLSGAYLGLCP